MKRTKMSLVNIQGKLSRADMKIISAGNAPDEAKQCKTDSDCGEKEISCGGQKNKVNGVCRKSKCYWNTGC